MANGFVRPTYPGVSNLADYGPQPQTGGGGPLGWLQDAVRRSLQATRGSRYGSRRQSGRPFDNARFQVQPEGPPYAPDYPGKGGALPQLPPYGPDRQPFNPYYTGPQPTGQGRMAGAVANRADTFKQDRNVGGLPREAYGTMGAARPGTQYYDQAALNAAAPYATARNVAPGWHSQNTIDKWSSIMGQDQLRGLMPLIQRERDRLMAEPGTVDNRDFATWYAANPSDPTNTMSARERYDARSRIAPTQGGAWQQLTGMFPGLGQQTNGIAQELFPGMRFHTPESARLAGERLNATAPPGQQYTWHGNSSPQGGSYVLGNIPPVPGARPARPTSYRGGIPRR